LKFEGEKLLEMSVILSYFDFLKGKPSDLHALSGNLVEMALSSGNFAEML